MAGGEIKLGINLDGTERTTAPYERALDTYLAGQANKLIARIKRIWPVKTGFSKARWDWSKQGRFKYVLENSADYALFVHRKGRRGSTIFNTEIKPAIIPEWKRETAQGIREIMRQALRPQVRGGRLRL